MTNEDDIDAKALALLNEVRTALGSRPFSSINRLFAAHAALCRAIEAHEAYKQKVSDAMVATSEFLEVCGCGPSHSERQRIAPFIIHKPQPDPLVEVLDALKDGRAGPTTESYAACLRTALDAVGLEIREKGQ